MAEIRVPAWPMPIHQTKFTIAKPHATGMLIPQMPTPFRKRHVIAKNNIITSTNANAKPSSHPRGCRCSSTISLIVSRDRFVGLLVTDKLRRITERIFRGMFVASSCSVRICDSRQIRRARARVQLAEHRVVERAVLYSNLPGSPRSFRSPKMIASAGHACAHAGTTSPSRMRRFSSRARDARGFDALHAIGAFLHHPARTHGHVRDYARVAAPASGSPLYSRKLNRRTLYGQLFEQ